MKHRTRSDIANDPRVETIFKDSDGWWVWLLDGYVSSDMECGTIHEMTITQCCEMMDGVVTQEKWEAIDPYEKP